MTDAVEFHIGETVYHRADGENERGIVTGILFRPGFHVFCVTWSDRMEQNHYAIELSREPSSAIPE